MQIELQSKNKLVSCELPSFIALLCTTPWTVRMCDELVNKVALGIELLQLKWYLQIKSNGQGRARSFDVPHNTGLFPTC